MYYSKQSCEWRRRLSFKSIGAIWSNSRNIFPTFHRRKSCFFLNKIRVRVTRSIVLCVCFVYRCLSICPFSFGHCVVCPSIYGFWLPLWYLQTLLTYTLRNFHQETLSWIVCEKTSFQKSHDFVHYYLFFCQKSLFGLCLQKKHIFKIYVEFFHLNNM